MNHCKSSRERERETVYHFYTRVISKPLSQILESHGLGYADLE